MISGGRWVPRRKEPCEDDYPLRRSAELAKCHIRATATDTDQGGCRYPTLEIQVDVREFVRTLPFTETPLKMGPALHVAVALVDVPSQRNSSTTSESMSILTRGGMARRRLAPLTHSRVRMS